MSQKVDSAYCVYLLQEKLPRIIPELHNEERYIKGHLSTFPVFREERGGKQTKIHSNSLCTKFDE